MGAIKLKHAVVCAVLFLTMGCKQGNDLQLGPALVVVPDPNKEFVFNASVKNFGNELSPEAYLLVIVKWASPHLSCGNGGVPAVTSYSQKIYDIPSLQPNASWTPDSKLVTEIASYTDCHCKQDECAGTISFTLLKEKLPEFVAYGEGPNKSVKVQWSADGNAANLVRTDLNGSIPQ